MKKFDSAEKFGVWLEERTEQYLKELKIEMDEEYKRIINNLKKR